MDSEALKRFAQTGDMLFFSGVSLWSRTIQRWTRSRYSHVGVLVKYRVEDHLYLDVIEALEGKGVRQHPIEIYLQEMLSEGWHADYFRIKTTANIDRGRMAEYLMARRGKRYSPPRQLLRSFVTLPLAESLGWPTKIDGDRPFCSWLATDCALYGGWQPPPDEHVQPHLMSPGDVSYFDFLERVGRLTGRDSGLGLRD